MIAPFMTWSLGEQYLSQDYWDLWATRFGQWAKKTFHLIPLMGAPAVGPLLVLDLVWPGVRCFVAPKRVYPICLAHMGLGYLNIWEATQAAEYLAKAIEITEPLLQLASPRANGLGWGLKHDWMTVQGLVPSDTPCNTQTAYAYELFARLSAITGERVYREIMRKIARHVAGDFPEWKRGDRLVCAYSTCDQRKVVNANGYRMWMLLDSGKQFGIDSHLEKGIATLRYVLSMQQSDGSWPYSEDQPFVDTYHTCFVLKNLHKARIMLPDQGNVIKQAIESGLDFLLARLFDKDGYPKPFARKPRLTLHKYDSYDFAETIGLLAKLELFPELRAHLIEFVRRRMQTPQGWFIFRIYPGWRGAGIPYMRHANSALFLALTEALRVQPDVLRRF
jgi:hypothetical protein